MENKKRKKYIILLIVAVCCIALLIVINVIGAKANTQTASAEGETSVPEVINPNLLKNGDFMLNTSNQREWTKTGETVDDWKLETNNTTTTIKYNENYILIMTGEPTENSTYINLNQEINVNAGWYTLTWAVNDTEAINQIFLNNVNNNNSWINFDKNIKEPQKITRTYLLPTTKIKIGIQLKEAQKSLKIYYAKLEIGQTSTAPYGITNPNDIYNEANTKGYNEGYTEGLGTAKSGLFAGATVEKAYMDNTGKAITAKLSFINAGISLNQYALQAEKNEDTTGSTAFVILINVTDFYWQDNFLYQVGSVGVDVTLITTNNKRITTSLDTSQNKPGYGYPLSAKTDELIDKIEVWNATFDYYGILTTPGYGEYQQGYNSGYNEGYDVGKIQSDHEVYQNGYNNGYQNGYNKGVAETKNIGTTIPTLLATVQNALEVKLFGQISLQDLLNIMLAITFVVIALKVFAGG